MSEQTPRTDAVLLNCLERIKRLPQDGPITAEHAQAMADCIQQLGECSQSLEHELINVIEETHRWKKADALSTKRIESLTAELEASNKRYHRLRESVNGMAPRDVERLEYFEKNYFGLEEANRGLTAELATVKQRLAEAEKGLSIIPREPYQDRMTGGRIKGVKE